MEEKVPYLRVCENSTNESLPEVPVKKKLQSGAQESGAMGELASMKSTPWPRNGQFEDNTGH